MLFLGFLMLFRLFLLGFVMILLLLACLFTVRRGFLRVF